MVLKVPQARAGEPAEVAKVALFLCSDASSYINGAFLNIGKLIVFASFRAVAYSLNLCFQMEVGLCHNLLSFAPMSYLAHGTDACISSRLACGLNMYFARERRKQAKGYTPIDLYTWVSGALHKRFRMDNSFRR